MVLKGYRVNWRSYDRQARPQAQAEPQYVQAAEPVARPAAPRQRVQQARAQPQPQEQPEPQPNYRPYSNAPPQIQQLLQFQQQIPYINIIPEPYRFETIKILNKITYITFLLIFCLILSIICYYF